MQLMQLSVKYHSPREDDDQEQLDGLLTALLRFSISSLSFLSLPVLASCWYVSKTFRSFLECPSIQVVCTTINIIHTHSLEFLYLLFSVFLKSRHFVIFLPLEFGNFVAQMRYSLSI